MHACRAAQVDTRECVSWDAVDTCIVDENSVLFSSYVRVKRQVINSEEKECGPYVYGAAPAPEIYL